MVFGFVGMEFAVCFVLSFTLCPFGMETARSPQKIALNAREIFIPKYSLHIADLP